MLNINKVVKELVTESFVKQNMLKEQITMMKEHTRQKKTC